MTSPDRLFAVLMAVLTLVAGLASRSGVLPSGLAKPAGVALWCALVYWLIVGVQPRLAARWVCLAAAAIGCGVELLQLTSGPAWLSSVFPPSRWVLGRAFHASDLPWYVAGAVLAAGVHALARQMMRRRQTR